MTGTMHERSGLREAGNGRTPYRDRVAGTGGLAPRQGC
jgi:hypothetical protein